MPTVTLTSEQAAAQITRDGHQWARDNGRIYYDFRDSMLIGTMPSGTGDFTRFTSQQIDATRLALMAWSDMAAIEFVENSPDSYSNSGWMLFGNYGTDTDTSRAAFAGFPDDTVEARFDWNGAGDVWINYSKDYNADPQINDSYGYEVLLHEIGHALGLQHPGNYNAESGVMITYGNNAYYVEDSAQYTVMSYFREDSTGADFGGYNIGAPMMDDIAAIQKIYGANTTSFLGNTIYGFNSNTARPWYTALSTSDVLIFCIWDNGGTDTIDLSGYFDAQLLDLRDGRYSFSNVGGLTKNLSIYPGVIIENGIGGQGADTVFGNDAGNSIRGEAGADALFGYAGRDSLAGGDGADTVWGGEANDVLAGDAGDDIVNGEAGNDSLGGGADQDTVNGGAGADLLAGDAGNDRINGDAGADTLEGGAGKDTLWGYEDADLISGGTETDDLQGGAGADTLNGDEGGDSLTGGDDADEVLGGAGNDTLVGSAGNDKLYGGSEADSLIGNTGDDTLDAGEGADEANGLEGNDSLLGGAGADRLYGHAGDDEVHGGADADTINGGFTNAFGAYDAGGRDALYGDDGNDQILGEEGNDSLYGGEGDDTLNGGAANDRLEGGAGVDQLSGGAGDDTYVYRGDEVLVEALFAGNDLVEIYADLTEPTLTTQVERFTVMVGTGLVVKANAGANTVLGGGGADTLEGGGGADTLRGGAGADNLLGGLLADEMDGGEGGDTYDYDGTDTITDTGTLGVDRVNAAVSAVMGPRLSGVETLIATGTGDIDFTGDTLANTLTGNGGVNTLDGKGGNDTLQGGAGNDSLQGAEGADQLRGDEGDDAIRGGEASSATDGGDDIRAGEGNDSVYGAMGSDTIYGEAGQDVLAGDAGDDLIDAGTTGEADTLTGGFGADTLYAGGGADLIDGASGNNVISAGEGNDTVRLAGAGASSADGGEGNDLLVINFQAATTDLFYENYDGVRMRNADSSFRANYALFERYDLTTGAGNDAIYTGEGADTVSSGAGNDTINTAAGAAKVKGGAGDDRWLANLGAATTGGTLNLNTAGTLFILGSSVTGIEAVSLTTGSGRDTIITRTAIYNDEVAAGEGDDVVGVGGGFDRVNGGGGNDRLIVDYAADTEGIGYQNYDGTRYYDADNTHRVEFAGFEHFTLTTGSGNDSLVTYDGDDVVSSGDGNDSISTGRGTAVINGGAGTDYWSADFGTSTEAGVLDLSLGTLQAFLGGSVRLIEWVSLATGSGNDVITTRIGPANLLNDAVSTGDGRDRVTVGGGVDAVNLGAGDDTLVVRFATSATGIYYENYDGLRYTNTEQTYRVNFAGVEHFDIETGIGADNIATFGGNDTLSTGAGNDTLATGAGRAVVDGGDGVDLWNADFSAAQVAGRLDLALSGPQAFFAGSVSGIERVELTTGAGNDRIMTLVGAANLLSDVITAGLGNDTVGVGGGFDGFEGGEGNDLLIVDYASATTAIYFENYDGLRFRNTDLSYAVNFRNIERFEVTTGSGNDTIVTFAGDDVVALGDGNDVADTGAGVANINGGKGVDYWLADLSAFGTGGVLDLAVKASQVFAGSTIVGIERVALTTGAGADKVLTLQGIGSNLNDVVVLGAGDDTVSIGGGVDTAIGGDGIDLLVVDYRASAQGIFFENYDGTRFRNEARSFVANFAGFERYDITTGSGNDVIQGGALDDRISTGAGDDVINTFAGSAIVDGGAGVDRWLADLSATARGVVLDLTKVLPQVVLQGTVRGIEVVNLTLGAGADRIVTGFAALGDVVVAGAGADVITVAGGYDVVIGGDGVDVLVADYSAATAAVFYENYDGMRFRTADYALGVGFSGIERFVLTLGSGDDVIFTFDGADGLSGGAGADALNGGGGNDTLTGGAGLDTLTGGAGRDSFVFDMRDGDVVVGFDVAQDTMRLDDAAFAGLARGRLGAAALAVNTTGLAETASDRIIYRSDTGALLHDADGRGGASAVQFAVLEAGLAITAADFVVF